MYLNLPNLITLFRIFLIPFYIYELMIDNFWSALALFIIGSLSDLLDGLLARRLNQVTSLGKFLDPLADKLFFLFSLSIMSYKNLVPLWFFGILLLRDILVSIGSVIYIDKVGMKEIRPHLTGKLVNFCIFFITLFVLIDHTYADISFYLFYTPLYYVSTSLSVYSLFVYWQRFRRLG
ncbi:MAG: CDP-alcohol phosphatidyltransferase family protein [Proteobacteria bacterium]|nr:CDP-alcohol phosphatidyltransferase family protein [Pseudomonadota bacterium]